MRVERHIQKKKFLPAERGSALRKMSLAVGLPGNARRQAGGLSEKERQKGAEGGEEDGAPDPGREPRGDPEAAGPGTAGRPV